MATKRATTTKTETRSSRYAELKKMLENRRQELLSEMQGKMRDVRMDGGRDRDVLDQGESSEVDIQDDIELALIQMKSETLNKIVDAPEEVEPWVRQVQQWKRERPFKYDDRFEGITQQHAIAELSRITRERDTYITVGVGQHQMWAEIGRAHV